MAAPARPSARRVAEQDGRVARSTPAKSVPDSTGASAGITSMAVAHAKKFPWVLFICVALFEVVMVRQLAFPVVMHNTARVSYRHKERAAAFAAFSQQPSPETKIAYEKEVQRAAEYLERRDIVTCFIASAVLVIATWFLVQWWRRDATDQSRLRT